MKRIAATGRHASGFGALIDGRLGTRPLGTALVPSRGERTLARLPEQFNGQPQSAHIVERPIEGGAGDVFGPGVGNRAAFTAGRRLKSCAQKISERRLRKFRSDAPR